MKKLGLTLLFAFITSHFFSLTLGEVRKLCKEAVNNKSTAGFVHSSGIGQMQKPKPNFAGQNVSMANAGTGPIPSISTMKPLTGIQKPENVKSSVEPHTLKVPDFLQRNK